MQLSFFLQVNLPFLTVLTWFLILGKIQDGDHCWWRHRPPAAPPPIKYTSPCREDQRLFTEGKIVSKYCNTSRTLRGFQPPHPPPLYDGGVMNLRVRPRVNNTSLPSLLEFFAFEVGPFLEELLNKIIIIIVSPWTTLAPFKLLYPLACSLVKVAALRFNSDFNKISLTKITLSNEVIS